MSQSPPGPDPTRPPHPSRRGPDGRPPYLPPLAQVADTLVVPDDCSALGADLAAYRRERGLARPSREPRPGRPVTAGPLCVLAVAALALLATAMLALVPGLVPTRGELPVATPRAPVGAVSGLLPDAALVRGADTVSTRSLPRPSALVLLPAGATCGCAAGVTRLLAAVPHAVPVLLVAGPDGADEAYALAAAGGPARVEALVDPVGALSRAVHQAPGALALVDLGSDGLIHAVAPALDPVTALPAWPGATPAPGAR